MPPIHSHGCVCEAAGGLLPDSAFKDFAKYVDRPPTLRLRGGAKTREPDATKVKTIVRGARIWTADATNPRADAIAISETGRILAVGSEASVKAVPNADEAQVVDLTGRTILPGFVEPHMHPTFGAVVLNQFLDVYPFTVKNVEDVLDRLRAKCEEMDQAGRPNSDWVWAFGYDQALTPPCRPLLVEDLDSISSTRPIFIISNTVHTGYANSAAFAAASVTHTTPSVPGGGEFLKTASGSLSGVVVESALGVFTAHQPKLGPEEYSQALLEFLRRASRKGVTTVVDAALRLDEPSDDDALGGMVGAYLHLASADLLPTRVSLSPTSPYLTQATALARKIGRQRAPGDVVYLTESSDMVSIHAIKFVLDGTNQTMTAAQTQPYLNGDGGNKGDMNYPNTEKLLETVKKVKDVGFSAMFHANGDGALDQAIEVYDKIFGKPAPEDLFSGKGFRGRIEHCTITREEQIPRLKELNVIPSFLMQHLLYWGSRYRDVSLGPARAARMDPAGDCVKHGMPWSMHCDMPVTPVQPLQYVTTAVTRTNYYDGKIIGSEQCVSVEEALKSITIHAAIQSGFGDVCGSLSVGKSADLVVLDESPLDVEPSKIKDIIIEETWIAGKRMMHLM
ncbi:hypothetical protein M427DRAFT_52452 [Gonapodya prolifera JEL478]|uniref:Amidohydrolase 3 domain-containing protein n=1 Tax=Gonapodya prolifera (strain JEL478) TaxID=1344416 RepID=A0A139AU23_GONPJ|nr:hypothetical protein M427DRAFT_52452 [Gonapodya prolifera JEL478]|eukprot:KXS20204.1 hypothetical protein M427DRAFT_52452 [Gonapodya prolifera JEL478]